MTSPPVIPACSCCVHPTRLLSRAHKTPQRLVRVAGTWFCPDCDAGALSTAADNAARKLEE